MAKHRAKTRKEENSRAESAGGKNRDQGPDTPASTAEEPWRERLQEHADAVSLFFAYKIRGPSSKRGNIPEKVSALCDATFEKTHSTIVRMNLSSDLYSKESYVLWNASNVWDALAYRANQEDAEAFNDLYLLCHAAIRGFFKFKLQVDSNSIDELVHDTFLQARDNIAWYPYNPAYPVYTFFRTIAKFVLHRFWYRQPTFQKGVLKREKKWVRRKFKKGDLLYFLVDMLAQSPEREFLASVDRTMVKLALDKSGTKPAAAALLGIDVETLERKLEQGSEFERGELIIKYGESANLPARGRKGDKADDGEAGIFVDDHPTPNIGVTEKSTRSSAETVWCFLEELRLCGYSNKPHHFVVFGFSRLLDYGSDRVVKECSDVNLRDLTALLMISLDRALGGLIGLKRLEVYFLPALEKCDRDSSEMYKEPEYRQLRERHGEEKVGDLALRDFYGKDPAHDIDSWVYRTARRARNRQYGSIEPGNVSSS